MLDGQLLHSGGGKKLVRQTGMSDSTPVKNRLIPAAIRVYKTKILPYFDQGDLSYMGSHLKSTDKLQKLQNRALRICLNTGPRNSRNTLHVQVEIPLLERKI